MPTLPLLPDSGRPKLIGIARLAAEGESIREGHNVEYFTLPTRSLLNRVVSNRNLPFTWAINPYRGCEFACKYCYARYTHEFMLERLDAGGLPIGISTDVPYQSGSVVLAPGDWLVIFTDGVVEAVNTADEEYGEQRLLAVVAGTAETTPADMMQRILTGLDVFVGNTPQHDDVTCLLVKVS